MELPQLNGAKTTDERQKGRLATPRGTGEQRNLTRPDVQINVKENLLRPPGLVVREVKATDGYCWAARFGQSRINRVHALSWILEHVRRVRLLELAHGHQSGKATHRHGQHEDQCSAAKGHLHRQTGRLCRKD